jgi:hypothetical protein
MIDWYWEEADELEKQEKWNEAKNFMFLQWKKDPQDHKKFIRLGFLCWYVVVEWGCIDTTDLKHEEYENMLKELTKIGFEKFSNNPDFLWTFGYMISLFPYYFGEYEEWEDKGKQMLKSSYCFRPNDLIIKLVFLGSLDIKSKEENKEYEETCRKVFPILSSTFRGDGELQRYFREVLNRVK